MLLSTLLLLCCGLVSGQRALEEAKVVVPRCCPPGLALSLDERFRDTLLPADVQALCTTVFNERAWKPRIYAHGYLEPGRVPSHWQLEYSRVPKCAKLRPTPCKFGVGLLKHNGRMRVTTNSPLTSNRFCADASVVLVCQPDVLKCCPPGHAVEGVRCLPDSLFHDNNHTKLLLNLSIPFHRLLSSDDGTAVGFPTCANDCQLRMVGDLDEASYEKDGVVELGHTRFGPDEWCKGQLINSNNTSIFACVPGDSHGEKEPKKRNEKMIFWKKLLEADNRDAELLVCKKMKEVPYGVESLIYLNSAEPSANQLFQKFLRKASKNERVSLQNGVITIQEDTQNVSWIARNKWSVMVWVLSGLLGCVCSACKQESQKKKQKISNAKRQKSQTDSNGTELISV